MNPRHPMEGASESTTSPVVAAPARVANCRPEWIRLPKAGTLCAWTGLSRSKLNELVLSTPANSHRPPVKSAALRQKGALKGVRLVHLRSLLDFIESNVEQGSR
jgi:hypothetical protein